jgi:hypothetical protein
MEVVVEISGAGRLEVDEMLAPVGGFQLVFGVLAVEHVGRVSSHRTAEHLSKRIDRQRVGFLRLQSSSGGHE